MRSVGEPLSRSLLDVHDEIAAGIDMSRAARADDDGRFHLLDDGRALDCDVLRQRVIVVDRSDDEALRLVEIDRPVRLQCVGPGAYDALCRSFRGPALGPAGPQPPADPPPPALTTSP